MYSCIYEGQIRHRRFSPAIHEFNYKLYLAYIDLDELDSVFDKRWFWSSKRPALARLKRDDYIGDSALSIKNAVNKRVLEETGNEIEGRVRMLTHLRYFGYVFNPVTFYYCFDKTDNYVKTVVAEITNTPWKERHAYLIEEQAEKNSRTGLTATPKKQLHVSPFWGMDHDYEWFFSQPEDALNVNMKNFKDGKKVFNVTLNLKRRAFTNSGLFKAISRFPFITLMVVYRIHWQAFILYIKRAPFFTHPDKL